MIPCTLISRRITHHPRGKRANPPVSAARTWPFSDRPVKHRGLFISANIPFVAPRWILKLKFQQAFVPITHTSGTFGGAKVSRRKMCQSAQKNTKTPKQELQNIADITTALWNEWISNSDAFQKRHGAKRVLDSFAQLSRALSQAAKSQEEFEHLATLCGHPLAQNHFRLGMLFLHKLDQDQAIENFRKSVDLDPTNYEHYMKYAEVLFNAKMYGTAIQAYTTILTASQFQFQRPTETPRALPRPAYYDHPVIKPLNLKPPMKYPESKLAEVVFRRALAHLQHQDLDEALADYRTVTSLDSNHRTALAWAYLAYLSRLYGKWTQTAELATKALEVDNQLLMALYERSMAYYVLKNEEAMKEDNRKFAILAHEKMWSLSKHPTAPEWGLPYVKPKRGRSYKL